jgi:transposase
VASNRNEIFKEHKLTIGLDLGDRSSHYCILDKVGDVILEHSFSTTPKGSTQVALLKQVKGVGTLIALTYVLTLDDPHRFRRSRDAGCFVGLRPGRRNSGMSEPQMHISKEGDRYLRTLLVQGAHYILGPFGQDSDLRRWGLRLAERGGKNAKKRAVIAVARKLAVPLHKLWVSGEVYEPLRNNRKVVSAVA